MIFLSPAWLAIAGLTALVLLLHMRRRRQVEVPSVAMWRLLQDAGSARRALRRPPASTLLALQLLVVALAAVTLAQPLLGSGDPSPQHTIYVVDASGSMRATDVAPNRFDAARDRLVAMISAATPASTGRISVVSAGALARIEVARQPRPAGIRPLMRRLEAGDGPADWAAATALADSLRRPRETTRVVVLTDGADAGAREVERTFPGIATRSIVAGADSTNAGLSAAIQRSDSPAGKWLVIGSVRFSGSAPEGVAVEALFRASGTEEFVPWATTMAERRGGGPNVAFDLAFNLPGPGAVQVRIPDDAGPHDNAAYFVVRGEPVRARVLYVGAPRGPMLVALQSLDFVDVAAAERLPSEDHTFDLVVIDDVVVSRRPATNVLWLGAAHVDGESPPAAFGPPTLTGWDTTHPLSDQIDWTALAVDSAYRAERLPGATVLAESSGVPLVQARTTPSGRDVQLAFDLAQSGWASSAGLPVFVSNLVRWLGVDLGSSVGASCFVGAVCPIESRFLAAVTPLADGAEAEFLPDGTEGAFAPARAGLYDLDAGDLRRTLAVNPPSLDETALAPLDGQGVTPTAASPVVRPLWWWLALSVLGLLLAEGWIAGRGTEQFLSLSALAPGRALATRKRAQLGLGLAAAAAVIAALTGLPLPVRESVENVVVVVSPDLATGAPNAARARIVRAVVERTNAAGSQGNAGLVVAGGTPRIAADIGEPAGQPYADAFRSAAAGANLEAAVLLAAAMLPADRAGRVVVATDGNETTGQVVRALSAARARGVVVDIEPITDMPPGEVLVESVHAPRQVYLGDTFVLDAVIYAQAPVKGQVTILRAGEQVLAQQLDLLPGRNRVETVVPAQAAGDLVLEVTVASPLDTFAENNRNGVIVAVRGPPSIAVVTPDPAAGDTFARALAVQGLSAKVVSPAAAPKTVERWLAYDAVVTMNLPAILLDTEQQDSLEQFVHRHGRGLLILGGENTFGPGGYFGTAFERMSPLSSRIPHDSPKVAIVFVLDRSGSMVAWADAARTATRLDVAREATLAAVGQLPDEARVGLVAFDHEAYVILPLTAQKDEAAVSKALSTIGPGGGTFIYPGLAAAMDMMHGLDVTARHIVVMTDGLSQTADFSALFAEAKSLGVTISAIAISSAADPSQPLLIAEGGGGGFYRTDDMRALPSILMQETLTLSTAPLKQGAAPVTWVSDTADFLQGIPARLPPVHLYVRTTLQPNADLHLAVTDARGESEPLLASWRYGNGRVLAFAAHGAGLGAEEWLQMPEYPRLWAQAVRAFLPDAAGPGLHVDLRRDGDKVRVAAEVLDKAGAPVSGRRVTASAPQQLPVALRDAGPGRYEGDVAVSAPGVWRVEVAADDLSVVAALYVGYPARFDFARADFDKMHALATATGGRVVVGSDTAISDATHWVARPAWQAWTLLALALFLVELTVRYAPQFFQRRNPIRIFVAAHAAARR